MATTTNYGWDTPDDTDLVKDGAAAIRTLGSSIDTTTKNLNPQTTTGALAYRSATANVNTALPIGTAGQILAVSGGVPAWINNDQGDITEVQAGTGISVASGTGPIPVVTNTVATAYDAKADLIVGTGADAFARLSVGTNGHVLTADSSVSPTGLKWAAPASSAGLTLISRSTFTGVTNVELTGVISASYDAYLISVEKLYYSGASTRNLLLTLLYSTNTEQTTDYYFNTVKVGSSNTNTSGGPASSWNFCAEISSNTNQASHFLAYLSQVNNQGAPQFSGHGLGGDNFTATLAAGLNTTSRSYTGIKLTSSNGSNFHGTVAIYGLGI